MNNEALEIIKKNLPTFTLTDYFTNLSKVLSSIDVNSFKPLRVFILRSYTAEAIQPILQLRLICEGYNPVFYWGDFNQFSQEILHESSNLYICNPDLILWMIRIEDLLPDFISSYGEFSELIWKEKFEKLNEQFVALIDTLNQKTSAQILLQNFDMPSAPYWGIYDVQKSVNQKRFVQEFNCKLSAIIEPYPKMFVWDFVEFIAKEGRNNIYDSKQLYTASNPFKQSSYISIVNDLMLYIISILGNIKKCIVLDLDNTLWGGVIGEDGMEGIALGYDYPGNCYMAFQKALLKLYHRGIILAINSKNNESDAFEVIDKHPCMVLKRKHFAAYQINWNDKVSNLKVIAQELNIGLDSMIFVDDSSVECELVKKEILDCTVIQVPSKPYLIPKIVLDIMYIENIRLTEEDRDKGQVYQAQVARKSLERTSTNLADFLNSLEMQVAIKIADKFSIPRIAQLTQKTNQLNMTTRRYTEADIVGLSDSADAKVFSITSKDRFGDSGIVGVIILKFFEQRCVIDSLLLSCRVIERTIEQTMLAFIVEIAKKHGVNTVVGEFIPTAKNKPAQDIYVRFGFTKSDGNMFILDLQKQQIDYSPYIKILR